MALLADYLLDRELIPRKERFMRLFRPSVSPAEIFVIKEMLFECSHSYDDKNPDETWAIYWDCERSKMVHTSKSQASKNRDLLEMCRQLQEPSSADDVQKAFDETVKDFLEYRRSRTPIYRIYYKIYSLYYTVQSVFHYAYCTECGRPTRKYTWTLVDDDKKDDFKFANPKCFKCTKYEPIDLDDCIE